MTAATTVTGGRSLRSSAAAPWRHVDITLAAAAVAVAGLGVLMVYSATRENLAEQGLPSNFYLERQAMFVLLGIFYAGPWLQWEGRLAVRSRIQDEQSSS